MKNFKKVLILFLAIFLTSGCSTINTPEFFNKISKSSSYLQPSSSYLTSYILKEQKSQEKRVKMARVIYDISLALENLTPEDDVSPEAFSELISSYISDESHWKDFAVNLILLYADFYSQVKDLPPDHKVKVLIKAINRINAGCRISSVKYL